MRELTVTRPTLFDGQQVAYDLVDAYRFTVLNCGRRWGKDFFITALVIDYLLNGKKVGLWSPEVQMSTQIYNLVYMRIEQIVIKKNANKGTLETINGGVFECWHTKENTQGRGRKYQLAIINECAFTKNTFYLSLWVDTIRPTLSTKGEEGKALFSSSPFGSNHFEDLASWGQSKDFPHWAYLTFTSAESPYVTDEEVEAARRELPPALFARNYLASFEGSNEKQLIERSDFRRCVDVEGRLFDSEAVNIGVDFCGDSVDSSVTSDYNSLIFRHDNIIFDYELNKLPQDDFCDYIVSRALEFTGRTVYITVDHIGVGSGTVKTLRKKIERLGPDVEIIVRPYSNKITSGRSNGVLDSSMFFDNTARIFWLLRRAIKARKLVFYSNKFTNDFESQIVSIEFDFVNKGQDSVIRIFKKGVEGSLKSPDLPDGLKYACPVSFLKRLLNYNIEE